MTTMTISEAEKLEEIAARTNDGHCPACQQTIKIYRYHANKAVATFMRAMADAVRNTNVNDVDISTIGLPYSVRTQVSKIRQHGLIARVKNEHGVQIPRRWLITHKGWDFVNGKPIPARVVVFNNQVLGHDEGLVTIHGILGEKFDPYKPIYEETPVSPAEARTLDDVRQPTRKMEISAQFRGSRYSNVLKVGETYELKIDRLQMGRPVCAEVQAAGTVIRYDYRDIAGFQKDWKVLL